MKKFSRTYDAVMTIENLLRAWERFLSDKKNRTDVGAFRNRLMDNVCHLHIELVEKAYKHGEYHAFNISDPKPRLIHKATVRDRLVHHLLHTELYPYFDALFIYDSYSCRFDKGTHRAMNRFRDFGRIVSKNDTRTCWVLKCDIRKFFANIDHEILIRILARHIRDEEMLRLLSDIIGSFSTEGKSNTGLPLGNLTSQLLVNIYMNEFDHFMKREVKVPHYIRYADDFVILHQDRNYLANLIPRISDFLKSELKLSLHPDKLFLKTLASGVDFLGWVHFPDHRLLRTASKRRMFRRIEEMQGKEETVTSYLGLLSHGNAWGLQEKVRGLLVPDKT